MIRTFVSRDIEPDVRTGGFSFIFEVDSEEVAVFVSILRGNLTSAMSLSPDKKCVWN